MGGFDPEIAKTNLSLPNDFKAVVPIILGYKGNLDRIPKEYQEMKNSIRERKSINSFVFEGGWK